MHTTISYKGDNTKRRAICDLCRWFGLSKSKLIIRGVRAAQTYGDLDELNMVIGFGGCEGEPVRRLFAHVHGEPVLQTWFNQPDGSTQPLTVVEQS